MATLAQMCPFDSCVTVWYQVAHACALSCAGVAVQASAGRLGIITQLKFPIVPQMAVQRSLTIMQMSDFTAELMSVQEAYKAALLTGSQDAIAAALKPLDDVQVWACSTSAPFRECGVGLSNVQQHA